MEYSKEDLMEAKKQIWGVGDTNMTSCFYLPAVARCS